MKDENDVLWEKIVDNGLQEYLIAKGVTKSSIINSRTNKSLSNQDLYCYYNRTEREITNVKVPLDQVEGISRVSGYSWFDILDYSILGIAQKKYDINIDQSKFLGQLLLLEKNGRSGLQEMYNKTSNISFIAFKNGDEVQYFQCTDGNHRVTVAKILGLKTIRARNVSYYEYDREKHRLFKIYNEERKKFQTFLDTTDFKIGKSSIYLEFSGEREPLYFFRLDLTKFTMDPNTIYGMIGNMKMVREEIQNISKKSELYMGFYKIVPKKLLKIRKKLLFKLDSQNDVAKMIAIIKVLKLRQEYDLFKKNE